METLCPRDEADVLDIIKAALANATPIEVTGNRSRHNLGRPAPAELQLDCSGMRGVSLYEPAELVLTAAAGTPLHEIEDLLDQQGQELAFEPFDHGRIYGGALRAGTCGGMAAVNACGSRRIKVGAARDHLLGFHAVSGRGESFQSGGRVMKNVTGYDLSKLMAGSFGTLAVLTDVTFKVLPKAETEQTLLAIGLDDAAAIDVMTEASGLPFEISCLAHLPAVASRTLTDSGIATGGRNLTALRLEGPEVSVVQRRQASQEHFKSIVATFEVLDAKGSQTFWANVGDGVPISASGAQIWRLSVSPSAGAKLVEAVRQVGVPVLNWYFDWAGGLVWLACEPEDGAHALAIRAAVDQVGGHAMLVRADDTVRATVPVFHPQAQALAALSARIKTGFDPERILNRGRMREDL